MSLSICSCTVGPDFVKPELFQAMGWKNRHDVDASVQLPDTWWTEFKDERLERLIARSVEANPDLAAARARVATARALVGLDRARMFPQLDLTGALNYGRRSESATTRNLPPGLDVDLDSTLYRGGFDLAYDLDLWGANRRSLEASVADAAAQEDLLDMQRLGLAGEVARQYFLFCGLDAQKAVLEKTIQTRLETLALQQDKADAGLVDDLPVTYARTELELARNDLADVERQRGAAQHALAVLCGVAPMEGGKAAARMPRWSRGTAAGVLMRRPDVRAAEMSLRAANARIGVAQAAFYPNFTLGAAAGFESLSSRDFLDWQNRVLSIGPQVTLPLFRGGSLRSSMKAAIARRDEALALYRNSLLVALREVEDAVVELNGLEKSRQSLRQAMTSARESHRIIGERHAKGLGSYLEVVDAERTVLRIELLMAQLDAQQRIAVVKFAMALGGGLL
ncbi:MAG: efflux transporter outer membrane subunit, partial [Luteolibacter sp.]